jgi:hypothetical protein
MDDITYHPAPWAQYLIRLRHKCGQEILLGYHYDGCREYPVFQTEPGLATAHCPNPCCGQRLNLDDCRQEPEEERSLSHV